MVLHRAATIARLRTLLLAEVPASSYSPRRPDRRTKGIMALDVGKIEVGAERGSPPVLPVTRQARRLRRLLYEFGPGNGTLLFCSRSTRASSTARGTSSRTPPRRTPSTSSGLRPRPSPRSRADTAWREYYPDYAGQVPLLLKLNSKTDIPPDDEALSPATHRSRTRCGSAQTPWATPSTSGSPKQEEDFIQLGQGARGLRPLRDAARDLGLPHGREIEKKGGRESLFAIDYAARVAMEMGADVVKLNMPKLNADKDKNAPAPYNEMEITLEEAIRHGVESAGRVTGGPLRGLEDRRRQAPRADAPDHGGRWLRA